MTAVPHEPLPASDPRPDRHPGNGLAVGIDVGGTKILAGLVAADGSVMDTVRLVTPAQDPAALTALLAATATELVAGRGLGPLPVGVGAPGIVDLRGVVRYAPNIASRDQPLQAELAALIGVPVTVENDANAAAWGEYRVGAGRGARTSMLMLTVGTGVGGGLVIADRLIRGAGGLAAEFGHMVLSEGGPACRCGNHGDLESLASGTAIGRMAAEAITAGTVAPDSLLGRSEPTGKAVTVAAHAGDAEALRILGVAGFWLGVGIASLVNALDPELVVVGGGALQAGELLLAPARRAAHERIMGREHRTLPPIVRAELADTAGLVGAALLALDPDSHAHAAPGAGAPGA